MTEVSVPVLFDYSSLGPDDADQLRRGAARIREHLARSRDSVICVGIELRAAKGRLDHGLFARWVVTEFAISPRLAELWMSVARFAANPENADVVKIIPTSGLYLLSAPRTPAAIRQEALAAVRRRELQSVPEIKQWLRTRAKSVKSTEDEAPSAAKPITVIEGLAARAPSTVIELADVLMIHLPPEVLNRISDLMAVISTTTFEALSRAIRDRLQCD